MFDPRTAKKKKKQQTTSEADRKVGFSTMESTGEDLLLLNHRVITASAITSTVITLPVQLPVTFELLHKLILLKYLLIVPK